MDENYNKNTIFVIQIHVLLLILFKLYTNLPTTRAHAHTIKTVSARRTAAKLL